VSLHGAGESQRQPSQNPAMPQACHDRSLGCQRVMGQVLVSSSPTGFRPGCWPGTSFAEGMLGFCWPGGSMASESAPGISGSLRPIRSRLGPLRAGLSKALRPASVVRVASDKNGVLGVMLMPGRSVRGWSCGDSRQQGADQSGSSS